MKYMDSVPYIDPQIEDGTKEKLGACIKSKRVTLIH